MQLDDKRFIQAKIEEFKKRRRTNVSKASNNLIDIVRSKVQVANACSDELCNNVLDYQAKNKDVNTIENFKLDFGTYYPVRRKVKAKPDSKEMAWLH